jgi:hypothetical protein
MDVKHKSSIPVLLMQGLNMQSREVHHSSSQSVLKYRLTVFKLTLSDPMSDLVRYYDFPVPDTFLDL